MYNACIKYRTDKITHHGYERFYDYFLYPLKNKEFNLLEIGIDQNCSLKMWCDLFSKAKIYGIDIGHGFKHDQGIVFKADQSNKSELKKVVKYIKNSDLIIDDGSHVPEHQLLTFNYLFLKLLNFGGTYIIEDIETSYWKNSK